MQYTKFTATRRRHIPLGALILAIAVGGCVALRRLPDRHLQLQLSERILRRLSTNLHVSAQFSPVLFAHLLQQSHCL
jgi:hypothetical protein